MCTAIRLHGEPAFFGRNLDLEYHYNEEVIATPCGFDFNFRHTVAHGGYSMLGVGIQLCGYPLYYDAVNEHGLAVAGLNFVSSARYRPPINGMINLAAFELIPYLLSCCKSVAEAKEVLPRVNLTADKFNSQLDAARLHFMLADKNCSLVAEPLDCGMRIYDNPYDVLTNEPPFDFHTQNLTLFRGMSAEEPDVRICESYPERERLPLYPLSRGLGGIGIPGDLSSPSRFIRAAFGRLCSQKSKSESGALSQLLHLLGSVAHVEGCVRVGDSFEKTVYTSAVNLNTGTYFVTTYGNPRPTAYHLSEGASASRGITCYPIHWDMDIREPRRSVCISTDDEHR